MSDAAMVKTSPGPGVRIIGNPDFGTLEVDLQPGQAILVEGGAMAYMAPGMEVKTRLMGGFLRAMIRRLFGGESLFVTEYSHPRGGVLGVSPAVPGKVMQRQMRGETIYLQGGSFLACDPRIYLGTKWGGFRALFSGEGAFFLEVTGQGDLFFNAHGTIVEHEVDGEFIVDTGHVVGWEQTLDWKVTGMGNSLKATLFSGEGLVLRFSGRGKVWLQTRTIGGLAGWLRSYLG
ncbi:MAG: TIGR00266 family protein [Planctomycetota bacterium]